MSGVIRLTKKNHGGDSSLMPMIARSALRGMIAGIILTVLLLLLLSAIALSLEDPDTVTGAFAYAALALGSLVSGIAAGSGDSEHRIPASALGGVGYVLFLWLVSLFFRAEAQNAVSPVYTLLCYIGCVAVSLIGGTVTRPRRVRTNGGKRSPTALLRGRLGRR